MPRWSIHVLTLPLMALVPSFAFAQQTTTSSTSLDLEDIEHVEELDLESLLGTVTAASRTEELVIKAPATVTVLKRRLIRLSGARSIAELIRLVPGADVVKNSEGSWVVSLRGTSGLMSNNVVVLLDGVPMNSAIDASIDWGGIPVHVQEIERIEVVRGPVSTIYGANAYTGVIAIVTDDPIGPRASLSAGWGQGALGETFGSMSGGLGERWSYRASASATFSPVTGHSEEADESEISRLFARASFEKNFGEASSAHLSLTATQNHRLTLDHLVPTPEELLTRAAMANLRLSLVDHSGLIESIEMWGRGQIFQTRADEASNEFTYAGVDALTGTLGIDFRLRLTDKISASVGLDAGASRVDAPFLHPDENARLRQAYGIYANATADFFDHLSISIGARGDISAMSAGLQHSLRASATYYTTDFSLRASVGSAFRHPTLIEAGSRLIDPESGLILLEGSPTLAAPRLDSAELGALVVISPGLTLKPTIYIQRLRYSTVTNFTAIVRKTFVNDDQPRRMAGSELELEWKLDEHLDWRFAAAAIRALSTAVPNGATIGVAENNPTFIGATGLRGRFFDSRLNFGLDFTLASGRSYDLRAGIPPRLISADLSPSARVSGGLEYRLFEEQPLWVGAGFEAHVSPDPESALGDDGYLGPEAMISLEWRAE
jgi:outer membrane cobalamin receptor